jgi:hypothetical protein
MKIEIYHIGPHLSEAIVDPGVGFPGRAAEHGVV